MNKILITGGCGFIGSHLVNRLLEMGNEVVVLDDLSTGRMQNIPVQHLRLKFIQGSITDPVMVKGATQDVTQIVHLAAIVSVQASVQRPLATHHVNFDGALNVLEAAREKGIKKIVFASSAAVYGDPISFPISESTPPNPLTPYAVDKLTSEQYLLFYKREFGIEPVIFRFFNVFGSRQDPSSPYSGVISRFVQRALSNKPLIVFGDGQQTRDFIGVGEVVNFLVCALTSDQLDGRVINLGTGIETSLVTLVESIKRVIETPVEVRHEKTRPGDIRRSVADVGLLQMLVGRTPEFDLVGGLRQIIEGVKT